MGKHTIVKVVFLFMLSLHTSYTTSETTKIRVVSENFPPYNYIDTNGKFIGISTAVVKAVFKKLQIEFQPEIYPWARTMKTALEKHNTLIYSIGRNPKKEKLHKWVGIISLQSMFYFAI